MRSLTRCITVDVQQLLTDYKVLSSNFFLPQCPTGFAGDGVTCGPDSDLDGFPNMDLPCVDPQCRRDNCPVVPNADQGNVDGDGFGDVCDDDADGDGLADSAVRSASVMQYISPAEKSLTSEG